MHRRSFIALAAVTPLAGCSGLLGGGVDSTLSDEEFVQFEAEEGAELTVSVDVQEIDEPASDADVERDSVGVQIQHEEENWARTEDIEGSETYEVTIEHGGDHRVLVIGGTADVSIE
ncbi:hypothetical protein [Natronobacterium texcoconense]|uniref:Uncharacterized protein n=1 Tax=Natronobacterium texcoconense TaxID=1095778 RepID=A0A1H1I0N8_NATTX|nr:hypothetical protein [Natronobacterium texcoconense]SDR31223.1 hypothetical protein SAMN04489842_3209 [Natronobacterium texcoconense]